MKKIIRIIFLLLIIVMILPIYNYRDDLKTKNINRNDEKINGIVQVDIIDRYNKISELHKDPKKENYVLVDMVIDNNKYYNVGIRTKGSTVYDYLKQNKSDAYSYKIKLDYTNKEQKYKGMTELHINSQVMDETKIREYLVFEVYNKMGIDTQKYFFGNLKIENNDRGLVTIVEVVNEDYVEYKYGSEDGNLYKPEKQETIEVFGGELKYRGNDIQDYRGLFDNVKTENTKDEDKIRLIDIISKLEQATTKEQIESNFMDFDKVIKMVAINKAVANVDSFIGKTNRNYFIYEENGKIDILQFDFNMSLGVRPDEYYWTLEDINALDLIEKNIIIIQK